VRPGLTGPGQVHFTRHQAAALDRAADPERHYIEAQLHAKLAHDLAYLRRRTLGADLALLARTAGVLLSRPGREA
jgi:lipopolysaccharide/colanic/teichoic acid biosynthesis glycosyltransferase